MKPVLGQPYLRNGIYGLKMGKKGFKTGLQPFLTSSEISSFVRISVVIFQG